MQFTRKPNADTVHFPEAEKLFGATGEEIQEAAHYAKMSVGWSAYLNGMQIDYEEFAQELQQVSEYLSEPV